MLRPTAAKAFGAPDPAGRPGGAPASVPRGLAVDVLFEDLREAVLAAVGRMAPRPPEPMAPPSVPPEPEGATGAEAPGPPAAAASDSSRAPPAEPVAALSPTPAAPPIEVSPPRPRVEGIEFTVEGPAGRVRCIHTLKGFLRVRVEPGRDPCVRSVSESLVTLHAADGGLRPVEKPLRGGGESGRTPFRWTSVPELVARWLETVSASGGRGGADLRGPRSFGSRSRVRD